MKTCIKCGETKDLSFFYTHKRMTDGHLNSCKECVKSAVRKNRSEKSEQYKRYEQMRFQTQPHRRMAAKEYAQTEEGRMRLRVAKKLWQDRNPEKRAAHVILGNAVRDGRIEKPNSCTRCGNVVRKRDLHAHHSDYGMPLNVEWICVGCHAEHHWPNEFRTKAKNAGMAGST